MRRFSRRLAWACCLGLPATVKMPLEASLSGQAHGKLLLLP
jgi:hypothetical protein